MTRKDYILIAEVFAEARHLIDSQQPVSAEKARAIIAREMAVCLAVDNPRFDRERFLKACGVQS